MTGWLAAAAVVFIVELFLGTFYLLVICASLIAAGLAAWLFDTAFAANVAIAAVCSVIGILIVRFRQTKHLPDQIADDLDLGQTVILQTQSPDGLWQVQYRGTLWQARAQGAAANGKRAKITGKDGNILLVDIE